MALLFGNSLRVLEVIAMNGINEAIVFCFGRFLEAFMLKK